MPDRRHDDAWIARRWARIMAGLWALTWAINRSLVRVEGESMSPTLLPGQLVATVPAGLPGALRPGRIVVANDPRDPERSVIKRIGRLEDGHAWLVGDSPIASTDSRVFGMIPTRAIRRVVVASVPARHRSQGARPEGGGLG